jgi:hypothetical protein
MAARFLPIKPPTLGEFPEPAVVLSERVGAPGGPPPWVHGTHETIRTSASSLGVYTRASSRTIKIRTRKCPPVHDRSGQMLLGSPQKAP